MYNLQETRLLNTFIHRNSNSILISSKIKIVFDRLWFNSAPFLNVIALCFYRFLFEYTSRRNWLRIRYWFDSILRILKNKSDVLMICWIVPSFVFYYPNMLYQCTLERWIWHSQAPSTSITANVHCVYVDMAHNAKLFLEGAQAFLRQLLEGQQASTN